MNGSCDVWTPHGSHIEGYKMHCAAKLQIANPKIIVQHTNKIIPRGFVREKLTAPFTGKNPPAVISLVAITAVTVVVIRRL